MVEQVQVWTILTVEDAIQLIKTTGEEWFKTQPTLELRMAKQQNRTQQTNMSSESERSW